MAPVAVPVVVPAVKLVQSVHAITSAQASPSSMITTPTKLTVASIRRDIRFVPPFELSRARTDAFKHVIAIPISANDLGHNTHKLYRLRIPLPKQRLSVSCSRAKTPDRVRSSDTKDTKKAKDRERSIWHVNGRFSILSMACAGPAFAGGRKPDCSAFFQVRKYCPRCNL